MLAFLKQQGLKPVLAQRVVASLGHRLATAIDLLCYDEAQGCLWVVELKCGYAGDRARAAERMGCALRMQAPLGKAEDSLTNRHILQAVLGREMLVREPRFLETLMARFGVSDVRAAVLYANGVAVDLVLPPRWWLDKAPKALDAIAGV